MTDSDGSLRFSNHRRSPHGDLSEIVEGMVLKAGKDAIRKKLLTSGQVKPGKTANTLDELSKLEELKQAVAAIGGVRSYVKDYRNQNHHFPKNKKLAYKRFKDCRHGFIQGLKTIQSFRTAMKSAGLSGII